MVSCRDWFKNCFDYWHMKNCSSQAILDLARFDAAIFDLDGVVTQTARVHAAAWKNMFDEFLRKHASQTGQPFQPFDVVSDYRAYVDGKPRYEGVSSFLTSRGIMAPHGEPSDSPDQETICGLGNRKNTMFLEALHTHGVDVFPSTIALVAMLTSRGKGVAVVTASENCQEILRAAGVEELFDVIVDGRSARTFHLRGKPFPDTFVKAAELLGVSPRRAVVFEDALVGVEAGHAGHFGLVVGLDRADQAEVLSSHGADVVVSDMVELGIRDEEGGAWRSAQALPSALSRFAEIVSRVGHTQPIVFLDYDGTLTPIADRPELAVLSPGMRQTLRLLSRQCPVGIISGRDREDVTALVDVETLIYAGSHGFDIAGPDGLHIRHEVGTQFSSTLDRAEAALRDRVRPIVGAVIERKKFSIAVHYRLVDPAMVPQVEHAVLQVLSDFPPLRRSEGKKVFELQPRVEWNKGQAILWLLQELKWKEKKYYPLYIGDDVTDEDAFRALADIGVGIVVEEGYRFSLAQYALQDPHEVREFLMRLSHDRERAQA